MESNIQRLRAFYDEFRTAAYKSDPKAITSDKIKSCRSIVKAEKNRINETGDFTTLEQVSYYEDKFNLVAGLAKKSQTQSYTKTKFLTQLKEILKDEKYSFAGSQIKNQSSKVQVVDPQKIQNQMISNFFQSKKSKLQPQEHGFRSVLESVPISQRPFKKKVTTSIMKDIPEFSVNQQEYHRLQSENFDLKRKLQDRESLIMQREREIQRQRERQVPATSYVSEELEQEKRRIQGRLEALKSQNSKLLSQNSKLKSEKSVTVYSMPQKVEEYSPYSFNTRQNNLYKINLKNENDSDRGNVMDGGMSEKISEKMYEKEPIQDTFSEQGSRRYDSFTLSQSMYSERSVPMAASKTGIENSRTATKNKVAFFKSKMLISKDNDFEIGFKRSSLEGDYDRVRIIFYVNNKTFTSKFTRINYEYESAYYDIEVKEKMTSVNVGQEAREVIEIKLKSMKDINSVIEANFELGEKRYHLWVPVIFMEFASPYDVSAFPQGAAYKAIQPNRQFATIQKMAALIPNMKINGNEGYIWGKSRMYEGGIVLKWKEYNRLEVETAGAWIDALTFIFFDYHS